MKLGKCLRVRGVGNGVTSLDGCQAFSPKPKKPEKCAACGCHASFHQQLDGALAGTGVEAGGIVPGLAAISSNPEELPVIPKRGQARSTRRGGFRQARGVRAQKSGGESSEATKEGSTEKPAVKKRGAAARGGKTGAPKRRKSKKAAGEDGPAPGEIVYLGPGSKMSTISRRAAKLGLNLDHRDPAVGKPPVDEYTIAQAAARLGLELGASFLPDEGRTETIAQKAEELGLVLPEKPYSEGEGGPPGQTKAAEVLKQIQTEWASVVDLTKADAQGGGTKKRGAEEELEGSAKKRAAEEELEGSAKKSAAEEELEASVKKSQAYFGGRVEAWMKAALEKFGEREGAIVQRSREGEPAGPPTEPRVAPGQQKAEKRKDGTSGAASSSQTGQAGVREARNASLGSKGPKVFGEGILFARKTLADLISDKVRLERDMVFKEVDFQNKHLFFLRSKLFAKSSIDMYDAQFSTKIVVAYPVLTAKERGAPSQPAGTVRILTQRPFPCEKRPLVAKWLEGKSATEVVELSHLFVLSQYRNGAVSIPLLAYAYMRILKPAAVKYVVMVIEQRVIERYIFKHFLFLGFEFLEQTGAGESVVVLDLKKAVGQLYGPWRFT